MNISFAEGCSVLLALCFILIVFLRSAQMVWVFEFLSVLAVAGFFLSSNGYLSLCVIVFHALYLLQVYKTESLLGVTRSAAPLSKKIYAAIILGSLGAAVGISLIGKEPFSSVQSLEMTTEKLIEIFNGEGFPYLVMVGLFSALLMLGLVSERRKR